MTRLAALFCLLMSVGFAAPSTESAGAPPTELDPAIVGALQKDGIRVKDGARTVMELWFRTSAPTGGKPEDNATMTGVPHGALLGAIRFPQRGSDRRGQTIKPGVYTLRLSFFPQNGDHQGVAPQRDFLILSPAAGDKDLNATPAFEALMDMSRTASGTPHPAVLSAWKVDTGSFKPGIAAEGESDQALQTKIGDMPIGVIVIGVFNH